MRRAAVAFAVALVTLSLSAALAAPQDRRARGKVTAITATAITIDVDGKPMTFGLDTASTKFIARGGTTKTKEAERTGIKPTLGDTVKIGDNVEITYQESGGRMLATQVRVGVASGVGMPGLGQAARTLEGIVSEVSGATLGITPAKGEPVTFMVDAKTRVIGQGLGTMAKEKETVGAKVTLGDAVAVGDTVRVTYTLSGDMKHATAVRVVKKKT